MFGSYAASSRDANHAIADGAFAYIPVASNGAMNRSDWPEKNAFGRLTESWNQDPSMFVARSSTVCGLETRARLPGCSELTKLVAAANLTFPPGQFLSKFEEAVEEGFHAELHGMVGGAWDCQMHDGTSLDMGTMAQNIPKVSTALSPKQERFCDARRALLPPRRLLPAAQRGCARQDLSYEPNNGF